MGMRDAPQEVRIIVDDLVLLKSILKGIERAYVTYQYLPEICLRGELLIFCNCRYALHDDPNDHDLAHASSVYLALQRCHRHVEKMGKRYITAFKAMLRKQKIAEFSTHLEQAKTTLLMAMNVTHSCCSMFDSSSCLNSVTVSQTYRNACGERVLQLFSSLRPNVTTFAMDSTMSADASVPPTLEAQLSGASTYKSKRRSSETVCSTNTRVGGSNILLWLLQLPPNSPYRRHLQKYGRLVGTITWHTSTQVIDNTSSSDRDSRCFVAIEETMMISIELPIIRRAFALRSQKCFGQWKHCFLVSRIVPDNAPIFKFCATKDERFLRMLFDTGVASPFDQTASSITLLHVS